MSSFDFLKELKALAQKITNNNLVEFNLAPVVIDDSIAIRLNSRDGIDIGIDDVQIDPKTGIWTYRGYHVLLFIADQGWRFDDVMNGTYEGKKLHLCDCGTIEDMKAKDRFARYQATNNIGGIYKIHGTSRIYGQPSSGEAKLYVCKNCLNKLNYKGYGRTTYKQKLEIYNNFNWQEFFAQYNSNISTLPPNVGQDKQGYSKDWDKISQNFRLYKNWRCEQCQVDLSKHPHLLDVHHVNGVKQDNAYYNLKALCKLCHKEQPMHGHYLVSTDDRRQILQLRKDQGI